jgi:hypothetical protein
MLRAWQIALQKDGSCLMHASEELRNDKQVVLTAVAQKGIAIAYASVCHWTKALSNCWNSSTIDFEHRHNVANFE